MIEIMIEEVQDLSARIHGQELTLDEIRKKYNCEVTTANLTNLRNQLAILHQQMLYGEIGMFNANDI